MERLSYRPEDLVMLTTAKEIVESVRPAGTHPANLRQFIVKIDGKPLIVSLLSHPEKFGSPYGSGKKVDEGIDSKATIAKLQAMGTKHLIAMDSDDFSLIQGRWLQNPEEKAYIHALYVEDHTAPSQEILDKVHQIAQSAVRDSSHLAIYCRGGFGRSGTAACSLLIRQQIQMKVDLPPIEQKAEITDFNQKLHLTTPLVAASISFMRLCDPSAENDLRIYNQRASTSETTVETETQIRALEVLESRLRE